MGGTVSFFQVKERPTKNGVDIYPDFVVSRSDDLMTRGGSFYAVWDEEAGLWSTDILKVAQIVDAALYEHANKVADQATVTVRSLRNYTSNSWKDFNSYCTHMPSTTVQLDSVLAFANTPPNKGGYHSKKLPYELKAGSIKAYDRLISVLYAEHEREKLEWAIGSVVAGDSKTIQKFFVLYGEAGTGKSTFLNILGRLFEGYTATFDAQGLVGTSNAFATEAFASNPLVAIQHDSDLSKIEDNTKLNSIVSHEAIIINAKYQKPYEGRINALMFIGTNKSVKISDAKSGLIRRLIDVHPTGNTVSADEYQALMAQIRFELGAIAYHCLEVYRSLGPNRYSNYRPMDMIVRTDMFYNFVMENYEIFRELDGTTLKQAWTLYKQYCDEGGYEWRLNMNRFRDELRNYFEEFKERGRVADVQVTNQFLGFKFRKLGLTPPPDKPPPAMVLELESSIFDKEYVDQPAQYATDGGIPGMPWAKVTTALSDLDTKKLHFVKPGLQHVVIDFDLRGDDGEKNLALNLTAASMLPPTYAEFSQSGAGIHLHYLYSGDVSELSNVYAPGIEVKTFPGDASLRRKLSFCNGLPIATLDSGLPLKERHVIEGQTMRSERALRQLIISNLRKEIHPGTKSSIDFIKKILDDAWESGMQYDVTDMRGRILAFANGSTNRAAQCIKAVMEMKFASEDVQVNTDPVTPVDDRLVFFDCEVYPNLFVICWSYYDSDEVVRMINPSAAAVEELIAFKLIGFNNRRYDNHILYAAMMGYSNMDLFRLSQALIVQGNRNAAFSDAYNLSWADVWDYSSIKHSLKRFQIELGLNHKEISLPFDEPVAVEDWPKVIEYCVNDVVTLKAVFDDRKQDYVARQILAELTGLSINDTTQKHTARLLFGTDKNPAEKFVYTDLAKEFPGYVFEGGKSTYKGVETGEGGFVYAEPGMYSNVAVLDIASMHPTTIEVLNLFGPYTRNYSDLKAARLAIKRRDYDEARKMLGGALKPYLDNDADAQALAYSLKIVLNIVYGLTSASFNNPFRDIRNKDNIVAKRGALFMVDLMEAVKAEGFQVIHIKTDSIKIPDATPEIIEFVTNFGAKYGYTFEHETTYERFCLVNDAVYIAKGRDGAWTATGAQFAHPYVFKTLFSGEEVSFEDLAETKTVTTAIYLKFGDGDPQFVGRAGSFVPVREKGATLLRGKEDKFHAITGTKGWQWRESAIVKELGEEDTVDMSYYAHLVDEAIKNISKYGDIEQFRD
jgi:hypothetical protein